MSIGLLDAFEPTLSALRAALDFAFNPFLASLWSKVFCLSSQAF
jgi:hypothetical protein